MKPTDEGLDKTTRYRVKVTRLYGLSMQVCCVKDVTDEEILQICNKENPCGTTNGWVKVVRNHKKHPSLNPIQCKKYPERQHFLVEC